MGYLSAQSQRDKGILSKCIAILLIFLLYILVSIVMKLGGIVCVTVFFTNKGCQNWILTRDLASIFISFSHTQYKQFHNIKRFFFFGRSIITTPCCWDKHCSIPQNLIQDSSKIPRFSNIPNEPYTNREIAYKMMQNKCRFSICCESV